MTASECSLQRLVRHDGIWRSGASIWAEMRSLGLEEGPLLNRVATWVVEERNMLIAALQIEDARGPIKPVEMIKCDRSGWNGRTRPAHTEDWKQVCPACGREVKTQGAHYWESRRNGEDVSPATRVYCSNKCRQRAYRIRRAPERNALKSLEPNDLKLSDDSEMARRLRKLPT